ncbi:isochorismate synthase [Vacuolonema iberomarrocanum]|uniref:isochorismate synthase n=1 Tax=Vacuolonema iberomarrocanum TaxID=3454632 RepID=UPI0019FD5098|nr:isochorismate synthase [filamentous cyanobacterium LEGE 07170]
MQVLPHKTQPFRSAKTLYQHLATVQHTLSTAPTLLTLEVDLPPLDPLWVVECARQSGVAHFYLENPHTDEFIVGMDIADRQTAAGYQRFQQLRVALDRHCAAYPAAQNRHYFCSFTFFDQPDPNPPGFAPAELILPRWQIMRRRHTQRAIANLLLSAHTHLDPLTDQLWHQYQRLSGVPRLSLSPLLPSLRHLWQRTDYQNFQESVVAALQAIQQQQVKKLVLAHALDVTAPLPLNLPQSLHHLRLCHPHCYTFSASNGQGHTFLGASPETLLHIDAQRLRTDALAGSAARGTTPFNDTKLAQVLLNSPKERHEHQIVVDFLRDRLTQLHIRPQHPSSPRILKLTNIQHLYTPITGTVPAHGHPLDILAHLHPTPAVAGIPPQRALSLIQQHEAVERSLYAAPIGWLDTQGNARFVVGIRSALLKGNQARLYAGAGIVSGSNPEREEAEIQLKLQALLNALA